MADTPTIIGKDVIESLTTSMYDDSKFIYREYIQNAADQIDKAEQSGLLSKGEGEIHIYVDQQSRCISIEDNATGIEQSKFISILKNIANSSKERGVDKGFRGIGRLGGLAYCEKLIFETSAKGEPIKSVMTWDCSLLKKIINDRKTKEHAAEVIDRVTQTNTLEEDEKAHFFKVTLYNVTHPELLNLTDVRKYLSMVAPVPYSNKFIFKRKIYDELKADGLKIDEYRVFINSEQLFKGYSTYIYDGDSDSKRQIGEVIDVIFFKEVDQTGRFIYWGWYGITEKNQSLNQVNYSRGFRLRKANIQVGDEYTLIKLQRDRRFQFYFIGEVHAFDAMLIPNARRDYFSENDSYFEFEKRLKNFLHTTIYKLCYAASEINSSIRRIEDFNSFQEEFKSKTNSGFTDKAELQEYREKLEKKKEEAVKAEEKLKKIAGSSQNGEVTPINRILDRVSTKSATEVKTISLPKADAKPKFRTDNLTRLSKDQRKLLGDVFRVIKNVLPNEVAENLIVKIEEEMR